MPQATRGRLSAFLLATLAAASCAPVRYYQKQALSTRVMDMADSPLNTHFRQKTFYSIEGAAGGIGASAGGGCGCY